MNKYGQNHWNVKISGKFAKIQKKSGKSDKIPDKKIIISYLRNKLSILWRNMVKTIEIRRFEKWDQKNIPVQCGKWHSFKWTKRPRILSCYSFFDHQWRFLERCVKIRMTSLSQFIRYQSIFAGTYGIPYAYKYRVYLWISD